MESKKINQLATSVAPQTSDLTIIGDPITGVSKKITLLQIANLFATTGTVSSVAVTETGDALTITGSPITSAGTINIGFAGNATQYVRGDGALADFPTSTGGGSSVSYYLNSSVSQGTIGGVAYRQLSKTPISGAGTDITISANGYVASYITDANDPALLEVPGGNFNCEFYFSVNSNAHNPYVYAELYKYNGSTFTLLGSSQSVPEYLSNGTTLSPYYFAIPVATAALTVTDRLAVRIFVNVDTRVVTLHTENNHLCQVVTTFSKGLISLNNLTRQNQFFGTGTSGTDFNISSSTATHTFNLPVASATNTGKLSSTDWSTFNAKQPAGNYVTLDTTQTITGLKTFNTPVAFDNALNIKFDASISAFGGYYSLYAIKGSGSANSVLALYDGDTNKKSSLTFDNTNNYLYIFPSASGTIALTSQLTGGTVTSVGLSSATSGVTIGSSPITTSGTITLAIATASGSQNGLLSSTDWTTFNNKYNLPSLTSGSVLFSNGTTIAQNNANFFWDNTNSFLGVGTNVPSAGVTSFSATAATQFKAAGTAPAITFSNTLTLASLACVFGLATSNNHFIFGTAAGDMAIANQSTSAGAIVFGTGTTEKMRMTSAGTFSIGNTNSTFNLDVTGTGRFTGVLTLGSTISNGTYTYTLPSATGTLALTSALSAYLPLAGGTLTGGLSGTTGTFSGILTTTQVKAATSGGLSINANSGTQVANLGAGGGANITLYGGLTGTSATFSSTLGVTGTITANGNITASLSSPSFLATDGTNNSYYGTVTSNNGYANGTLAGDAIIRGTSGISLSSNGGSSVALRLASTGAATFSSSVTAGGATAIADALLPIQINAVATTGQAYFASNNNGGYGLLMGYDNANGYARIRNVSNTALTFETNNSEKVRITSGGNVGIGTSSPNDKLDVVSGKIRVSSTTNTLYYGTIEHDAASTGANIYNSVDSGGHIFQTNSTERMRITSGGNVGINTSSPSGKLEVSGSNSSGAGNVYIGNSAALNMLYVSAPNFTMGINASNGGSVENVRFYNAGTTVGTISTTGSLTSYNVTSDYRLKEDFKDYNALSLISKIKTYDYQWKSDKTRMYGVIAHEIQEILPYIVFGEKDAENMQSVDYSKLTPILLKAIQELEARIKQLENK